MRLPLGIGVVRAGGWLPLGLGVVRVGGWLPLGLGMLVGGCDFLFQLQHVDPLDIDAPGPSIDAPSRCVFSDNFDDNLLSSTNWMLEDPTQSVVVVTEEAQTLVLRPKPFMNGYNGVISKATFDMRNKQMSVLVMPANEAGFEETSILFGVDNNNNVLMGTGAGSVVARVLTAGVEDRSFVPLTADYRYWRLRHDAGANAVYFEYSPDGQTWLLQTSKVVTFSVENAFVQLSAGTYQGGMAAPGEARYDDLAVCAPE